MTCSLVCLKRCSPTPAHYRNPPLTRRRRTDAGFSVSDGRLYDANGNDFAMRGQCLDVDNQSTAPGTKAQIWDCNGQP
ncbi:RICIN domain-containing protein [Dactylosporangium siamense]|uniref:Ricin B lectin domain-containing protein n=1 Tax=Dactylosporangium siamense TaxID=685454 RepID=A0A919UCW0_9ACTN|nr:RICIN domain-containing protein [Dactylosporangium siamense]GIG47231.1 hypothetical protein Dsi01nite_052720 [Dactylosporangium siamense]